MWLLLYSFFIFFPSLEREALFSMTQVSENVVKVKYLIWNMGLSPSTLAPVLVSEIKHCLQLSLSTSGSIHCCGMRKSLCVFHSQRTVLFPLSLYQGMISLGAALCVVESLKKKRTLIKWLLVMQWCI